MNQITVSVNNEQRVLSEGTNIVDLLAAANLDVKSILVELNETVLHRHEYPLTVLKQGDRVEFIRIVAGG
jgi:thiamine biosynthesis protein ThiS